VDISNRTVHGLWVGARLSRLELLTIHSFAAHGHDFVLWTYSGIEQPLPPRVEVRDAAQVLPADCVFRRSAPDREIGVGRGSFAGFSDLFRYKLLYEQGGYWVDMDVTCLRPLDFREPYVFRSHRLGAVGNVMKCPPGSRLMKLTYDRAVRALHDDCEWHFGNRALNESIRELALTKFIRDDLGNPDLWSTGVCPFVVGNAPVPKQFFIIHWLHECWKTLCAAGGYYQHAGNTFHVPDKNHARPFTTLARLYEQYGL
jgi:hypothetical protein